MSTSVTTSGHRHSQTLRRGSRASSTWLKIASTPAYCDMAAMLSREPARARDGDLDPLKPESW